MLVLFICWSISMALMVSTTPMKYTISLTVLSLCLSVMSYGQCVSVFLMMSLVISFSSGMMILFSYCSVMTSYESKNKASKVATVVGLGLTLLLLSPLSSPSVESSVKLVCMMKSVNLMVLMSVVILVMLMINKSLMSPKKSLMSTY